MRIRFAWGDSKFAADGDGRVRDKLLPSEVVVDTFSPMLGVKECQKDLELDTFQPVAEWVGSEVSTLPWIEAVNRSAEVGCDFATPLY